MKQQLLPALKLTLVCILFFTGVYTILIRGVALFGPNKGKGETISVNGKVVGYSLEGQNFSQDKYFWGRPSAAGYNAAGSAGSNKGPSNPDYLATVQARIDSFLVHNPTIKAGEIPSEMVTASGSGLDPDISVQGAYCQVDRIARTRHLDPVRLHQLVEKHIGGPLAGIFGTAHINVLTLNIDLDHLQ